MVDVLIGEGRTKVMRDGETLGKYSIWQDIHGPAQVFVTLFLFV